MSQDDFAIYFVIFAFAIVLYGIPILITVFLGIKLSRSWQILSIEQRRLVICLVPLSVAVSLLLGFVALAHPTQAIYGTLQLFVALFADLALVLILFRSLIRRLEGDTNSSKFSYGVIGIFLLGSLSYSPLMSSGITNICYDIQRHEVIPLIEAMEIYRDEKGFYPEDFSDLFPSYIQQIPQPFCLKPYTLFNAFVYYPSYTILQCKNERALVVFSSPDIQSVHVYDTSTEEWWPADYYDDSCH